MNYKIFSVVLLILSLLFFDKTQSQLSLKKSCNCIRWQTDALFNWSLYRKLASKIDTFPSARTASFTRLIMEDEPALRICKVVAYTCFDSCNSWVNSGVEYNSTLLSHEKGHWDIQEIATRKLRKTLLEFNFQNGMNNNLVHIIDSLFRSNKKQLEQFNLDYDSATDYSKNLSQQIEWNKIIISELKHYEQYDDSVLMLDY